MRRIITLSTDFGHTDHYVGTMKGVILGINPDSKIVDITHEIPKYDIIKAALVVRNFYKYFPKDSIHVVVVDPGVGSERKPIAVESENGIFIGPDNGVFSFILGDSSNVFEITNREFILNNMSNTFHGRDIFAPTAAHLSLGIDIGEVGQRLSSPTLLDFKEPEIIDNKINGDVIYEDSFGNLITNIPAEKVSDVSEIMVDGHVIDTVATSYNDVKVGDILAIVGSSGFLEISVNQGSASKLIKDKKVKVVK